MSVKSQSKRENNIVQNRLKFLTSSDPSTIKSTMNNVNKKQIMIQKRNKKSIKKRKKKKEAEVILNRMSSWGVRFSEKSKKVTI